MPGPGPTGSAGAGFALAGGAAGTLIGLRPTLLIAAIGGVSGFAWLLPSPLPRFRMPPA